MPRMLALYSVTHVVFYLTDNPSKIRGITLYL
jgi:hypothetical protein